MADFQTQEIVFGAEGLDFQLTLDQLPANRFAIGRNWIKDKDGRITHRPGTTSFATGLTTPVHTITRLRNSLSPDVILIGGSTIVYTVPETGGAVTSVETGFSGKPLSVVTEHTQLTGDSWAFIADTAKMRKIRASDSLSLPIGLVQAGVLAAAISPDTKLAIDTFDNTGAWNNNAGSGGAPANAYDFVNFKEGTAALKFTTTVGGATAGYYNFWTKAYALDLDSISSPTRPAGSPTRIIRAATSTPGSTTPLLTQEVVAVQRRIGTDEDHFHFWLRTDQPAKILEIRIYFVISSVFTTTVVPGTSATQNTDAYIKILRPDDFTSSLELSTGGTTQAQLANLVQQIIDQLPGVIDGRVTIQDITAQIERARSATQQLAAGRGSWTEYGVVGRTLQRGEFRRIGSDTTRDWSNVTGIVVVAQTVDNTDAVNIWIDDLYFFGGAGPDSSQPGASPYDWRSINFDPRTGCKSLPSTEFTTGQKLDLIRRAATLTPFPFGDAAVRQRFYRRGGSLGRDWYFVGTNSADGGTLTDDKSDLEIIAAETLAIDNDAPVTTTDASGNTLHQVPLSSIFGPINDILFGCGDPYHPGRLYWSKATEYEHWPAANFVDVCPASEELLAGFKLGGQGFVFSRERLYAIYPNLSDSRIVSTQPTSCQKAPVARWCFTVGFGTCFFIERDGIYATNGGTEQNLTESSLRPMFHNQNVGIPPFTETPIDFSTPENLRLFIEGDYLWFVFKNLAGNVMSTRYNIVQKYWEGFFLFGSRCTSVYDDPTGQRVLLGGGTTGKVFTFTGPTDDGVALNAQFATGCLNQGAPRQKKKYGDIYLEFEGAGAAVTLTPFVNNYASVLTASTFTGTSSRDRYYADFTDTDAYDLGMRVTWPIPANGTQVFVHKGGISYIPLPEEVEKRVTDWDVGGRLTDKKVKGIVLECDTFGSTKSIDIQADGATVQTISVSTPTRQVREFSFSQFEGRVLRLSPADEVRWILYRYSWIFDEEPLSLTRWETQELTIGGVGWKSPLFGHFTVRSTVDVNLQVTAFRQDGTSVVKNYTISSTAGVKISRYVQFEATKGVLYKLLFTSESAFWLYREESMILVHDWQTGQDYPVKPFGNDDLDLVRGQSDASLTAARGGGG